MLKNFINKKILVVSHDAGGAEIISSYIKRVKISKNINFYLKGPAVTIFKRKIPKIKLINNIKKKLRFFDLIILGTSLNSNFEYNILKLSKYYNIKTISFLDHWVNYSKRFIRKKKKILPKSIIVGDKIALKLAKQYFKYTKIQYIKNSYLKEFSKKRKKTKNNSILFLSSNMDSFENFPYSDKYIFKCFLNFIKNSKKFENTDKIIIRKHPSENIKKYKKFKMNNIKFKIVFDNNNSLKESFKNIKFVVGYGSMGLVAAKMFGIKTINLYLNQKIESNRIPNRYIDINLKIC